jgi:hypothetical protein
MWTTRPAVTPRNGVQASPSLDRDRQQAGVREPLADGLDLALLPRIEVAWRRPELDADDAASGDRVEHRPPPQWW